MSVEINKWHRETLRQRQALRLEMDDELENLRLVYQRDREALIDKYNTLLRRLAEPATQSAPALRYMRSAGANG